MKYQSNYDVRRAFKAIFEEKCNLCNEDWNTMIVMFETLRVNAAADVMCVRNCYNGIRAAVYFLMMGDHVTGDQAKALIALADEIAGVD